MILSYVCGELWLCEILGQRLRLTQFSAKKIQASTTIYIYNNRSVNC